MTSILHIPVLKDEVCQSFQRYPIHIPGCFVDATLGFGGHSSVCLSWLPPSSRMICNDVDQNALDYVKRSRTLESPNHYVEFTCAFFDDLVVSLPEKSINWFLADLGVNSQQLSRPERGFSFHLEGPLDMRLNPQQSLTAWDLLNTLSQEELADIFWRFGEEPRSHRLAKAIVAARRNQSLPQNTKSFAKWVAYILQYKNSRRHPATRTFQALRIAVNQELHRLERLLRELSTRLHPQHVVCLITFHSLEAAHVESTYRSWERDQRGCWIVQTPSAQEIQSNPRSRSARLWTFWGRAVYEK